MTAPAVATAPRTAALVITPRREGAGVSVGAASGAGGGTSAVSRGVIEMLRGEESSPEGQGDERMGGVARQG